MRGRVGQKALSFFSLLAASLFFSDYVHLDEQLQRGEEVLVLVQVQGEVDVHLDEQLQRGEYVLVQVVQGEGYVHLDQRQQQRKGERKVFCLAS